MIIVIPFDSYFGCNTIYNVRRNDHFCIVIQIFIDKRGHAPGVIIWRDVYQMSAS